MNSAARFGLHQSAGDTRRPGFRMPCGSNIRLQPLVDREQRRGAADGTRRPTCRRRETVSHARRARAPTRATAPDRRASPAGEPAQRAAPLDQLLAAEVGVRRGRLAPTAATAACPPRAPRRKTRCAWSRTARQNASPSSHRLAAEPARPRHRPRASRRTAGPTSRPVAKHVAGQRQRLPAPFVDAADRLVGRHLERARRLGPRQRQALERHLGEHAERAERAAHQARDVEAGDVLHHAAAERQVARRGRRASGRRARGRAPRRHKAGADRTAPRRRRRRASRRRRSAAARTRASGRARAIACSIVGERRSGARGDHELGRLVVDDARVGARVEHVAARRLAVEVLRAAAADAQRASSPPSTRGCAPAMPQASCRSSRPPDDANVALQPPARLQLVAIDDARLVRLDDRRLRERRRLPFAHEADARAGCASTRRPSPSGATP